MQYKSEIYRKPFRRDLSVVQGMIVLHIDSSCFPPMALESNWRSCWWLTPGGLKHIPVASPSIILGLVHSLCLYKSPRHQLLFLCILCFISGSQSISCVSPSRSPYYIWKVFKRKQDKQ